MRRRAAARATGAGRRRTADLEAVVARLRPALRARTPVSLGAATLHRDGHDFDTLYASADARLYAEKTHRRDEGRRPFAVTPGDG